MNAEIILLCYQLFSFFFLKKSYPYDACVNGINTVFALQRVTVNDGQCLTVLLIKKCYFLCDSGRGTQHNEKKQQTNLLFLGGGGGGVTFQ